MISPNLGSGTARGETLIELLVAMTILGITVVALVGGIGTSILVSDEHRKDAVAAAAVRTYAEAIESSVDATPTAYVACPTLATYATPSTFVAPSGFAASVTAVSYWDGTAFGSLCSTATGIQKLALLVSSRDSRAAEPLNLIIRNPCRTTDSTCS